ncbi:uncharacterized protein [Linepithema humile]|uniref:uncharacterized protein n=1 Tax=Linepithema humile TaxID=83485 RepID=UPI000623A3C7|nr:PREDICTED: uncharacterized protein LOC105672126 [Linepithema humile]
MKSIVALCLLAVLCTVNAIPVSDDLEYLRRQVRETIYTIDNDILRLERLRLHTEEDTDRKVNDRLNEEQDNYRELKDTLLKDLKTKVNDAKDSGKEVTKVDNCYKDAVEGIGEYENQAEEAAVKCVENSETSIRSSIGSVVDNLIETGRITISELDDIFLDCHDIDIIKKKSCIVEKLGTINVQVRNFEEDIIKAEIHAVPLSNNVIRQSGNCFKNAYSSIYSAITTIKLGVQKCIKDVESKL